jgi:hypothetical protein
VGEPFPNKGPTTSQEKSSTSSFGIYAPVPIGFLSMGKHEVKKTHDLKFKHKS